MRYYMKEFKCKHCHQVFDVTDTAAGWQANHSRWCDKNPKQQKYKEEARSRHFKNINSKESIQKRSKSISNAHKRGCYDHIDLRSFSLGRKHSEVTKKIISEKARKSTHRRLKKFVVEYNGQLFDSNWEVTLAKRLDELNIRWIRPKPLKWIDSKQLERNYFPDFYLIDYDLYLDPKNKYCREIQKEKLDYISKRYNLRILNSNEECEQFPLIGS